MSDPTPEGDELIVTRVVDAPRELVFRCMIEPEHLAQFWGPVGTSTPLETITVDPRPGGVFETVMVNDTDGSRYPGERPTSRSWSQRGWCGPRRARA